MSGGAGRRRCTASRCNRAVAVEGLGSSANHRFPKRFSYVMELKVFSALRRTSSTSLWPLCRAQQMAFFSLVSNVERSAPASSWHLTIASSPSSAARCSGVPSPQESRVSKDCLSSSYLILLTGTPFSKRNLTNSCASSLLRRTVW